VALGIQHAMRIRHAVICALPGSIKFFSRGLINSTIFHKSYLITCVLLSLQLLSETFLILRRNERDLIKNVHRSSCNVTVIVVRL